MHRGTAVARVSTVAVDLMPIARRQQVADDIAAGRGMASLSHLNFTSFGPSVCRMKAARNVQRARQAAAAGRGNSASLSAPFGLRPSVPAIARASVFPYGFMLSTIELGIKIVAPRSLVVS